MKRDRERDKDERSVGALVVTRKKAVAELMLLDAPHSIFIPNSSEDIFFSCRIK